MAYLIWFLITPLLPEIRKTLDLSKKEIWTSSIVGVGGTIAVRFLLGLLCDIYSARTLFAMVLCMASILTAMTGLVRSATDLAVLRFFMGIAGGSFVMTEYWTR
jgi:MFS transporter, NNP family, nitrate/nitrite transporter